MPRKYTTEERISAFWNKVAITPDNNKCWLWTGGTSQGYGWVAWNGTQKHAHAIAWMLPDYVIPKGMEVCHSCDNPRCCNPKHLFLGTHKENMEDREQKGRGNQPKGERHGRHKLSSEQVVKIRREHAINRKHPRILANEYGVNVSAIWKIVNRLNWKHGP